MFGADFWAAGQGWLYPAEKQYGFWRAVVIFVLLFVLFQVLQVVFSLLIYAVVFHEPLSALKNAPSSFSPNLLKSLLIAMFPASVPILFLGLSTAKYGLPKKQGVLPLRWPSLGILGWVLMLFCFVLVMGLLLNGAYWIMGFDPLRGSGMVEKTMADLARDPKIFALALPSIILAAPLAEEFLFRGVLFASLTNTVVGRPGAVIFTAALWSIAHAGAAPWINVGLIFVMGLVLGLLLLRFGSLWVTIACHTAWNTMTALAIFAVGMPQ